jgi:Scd6-like Sm domain
VQILLQLYLYLSQFVPFLVRSFGTEDRETAYPIMPQPTVYDYILFRGADIKDIRVVNNVPIPNDPAIMQMHLPPQQQPGFPPQQQMPPIQSGPMQFGPFSNLQQGPQGSSTSLGGQNIPQQQPSQQLLSPQQSSSQQGNAILTSTTAGQIKKTSELSKIDLPSSEKSSSISQSTTNTIASLLRKQNATINNNNNQGVQKVKNFSSSSFFQQFMILHA